MPSPHIPLPIDIDLVTQRRDLGLRLRQERPNPSQRVPQLEIIHRPARFSKVRHDDGDLVVVGQDMFVDEEAVLDEVSAFSVEGHSEDCGEGDAEALEQGGGWDSGPKGVEVEGCWGAWDVVGDEALREDERGVGLAWGGSGIG